MRARTGSLSTALPAEGGCTSAGGHAQPKNKSNSEVGMIHARVCPGSSSSDAAPFVQPNQPDRTKEIPMETQFEAPLQSKQQKKVDHKEGPVARAIENQTAKLPSDVFLWLAGATIVGSAALKVLEVVNPSRKDPKGLSIFVGMWAPTLLLLGLYNKVVKVAGSDQVS